MEPDRLTTDTDLERALRSVTSSPLPDDGFSDRVLAALPEAPASPRYGWAWVLMGLAAAGALLFALRGGILAEVSGSLQGGLAECTRSLSGLWSPLGLACVIVLCAYFVFPDFDNEKSRD